MIPVFKSITIGGFSKQRLIDRLTAAGVQFNKYAHTLFEHPSFTPQEGVSQVKLVKVSFADLNLSSPCSYQKITAAATSRGLKLCPLYLAAFLRLEYLDQPVGPYLTIASAAPETDQAYPTGFYIRNFEDTLWLRGYQVDGEPEWPPQNEFIFCV